MNPLSLLLIGLGIIMVYIGWKGSQHSVLASLTGKPTTAGQGATPGTAGNPAATPSNGSKSVNAGTGNNGASLKPAPKGTAV